MKYTFNCQIKWFSGRIHTNHNAKSYLHINKVIDNMNKTKNRRGLKYKYI